MGVQRVRRGLERFTIREAIDAFSRINSHPSVERTILRFAENGNFYVVLLWCKDNRTYSISTWPRFREVLDELEEK